MTVHRKATTANIRGRGPLSRMKGRKTKAKKRERTARRKEMSAKPEEVVIVNDVEDDPVVRVRGKTVGAWIDL